ncbi:helix-turn-helix domain-containing protein [Saccharopolyspora mangrovi]|uniref:Helix-turn-helix domain-containing protein n=1 Tax=Saccharopolyspora mangrovi TaxID=3082379 RepID=A0ABU6AK71_9PSEU|nr:helix-turn-helix domain-containing protein [Saccharopolyspora sp. S2-29]MEB3371951.1 helix-turn-helix domain-containing protein [Saccharopolyspora sp. S2-29]
MNDPGELGIFLRGKRAALPPEATPLNGFGVRRRVPGLRREEVAQLAGVSVTYYTRLEQGHSRNASDEVPLALARALQLSVTETEHLLDLARARRTTPDQGPESASPQALVLLSLVSARPAIVLGRRNDVLAWNELGHALVAPHLPADAPESPAARPSLPRMLFLDPKARALYRDWDREAADYVAYLRMASGKHPDDEALTRMIGELCIRDDAFADLWTSGRVGECVAGTKRMAHPGAGEITVDFQLWAQSDRPEQRLEIYTLRDDPDGTRTRSLLGATSATSGRSALPGA